MTKKRQHYKQEAGEIALVDVNESVEVDVEKTPEAPLVLPGKQLAAFRQAKHLTVEDVSAFLKLAPRQVIAIENDDYAALPGMVITRGFFRAYAKMLEVDAAPLLAGLPEAKMPTQDTTPAPNIDARPFEMNWPLKRHSFMPKLLTILIAVAVIGAGAYYSLDKMGGLSAAEESLKQAELPEQSQSDETSSDAATSGEPKNESLLDKFNNLSLSPSTPASEDAGKAAPAPTVNNQPAVAPENANVPPAAEKAVNNPVPATSAAEPVKPVTPVAATPVTPAVTNMQNALQLSSSGESWVEARRVSDNKVVFSKLMRSGDVETVDVSEPIQVVIGNISGITATLRGQPVSMAGSKNNVARLTLK